MPSAHTRYYYGVTSLLASHPTLRKLRRQEGKTRLHGNKVWASSYLMMDYLQSHPLPARRRVLEIGCGWGLAGIYCAKNFSARVTASDADPAVYAYLDAHAQANGVELAWRQAAFSELSSEELAKYDTLIACDICFWDDMSEQLYTLLERAVDAGVKQILISDPLRPPFLAMAERCVESFFAELFPARAHSNRGHQGAILLIENA